MSINKDQLVISLCKLSANLCSYIKKPCDCKFIEIEGNVTRGSENGSGCPETMMAAHLIANMTVQEYAAIAKRAGIILEDDVGKVLNVSELINKFQNQKFNTIKKAK